MGVRRVAWNLVLTVVTAAAVRAAASSADDADAAPTARPRDAGPSEQIGVDTTALARETTPLAADTPYVQTGRMLVAAHRGLARDAARALGTPAGLRVCAFIVVLPDPIDSRLDWQFDAGLESTRRAFETSGFVLDRFWLPWTLDADSSLRKRDRQHAPLDLRRRHPGVLLFRRANDARQQRFAIASPDTTIAVAYLVGETPTGGIHQAAFDAAVADRDRLVSGPPTCPDPRERAADVLRVIGPTFSGSIASLRRSIERWLGPATPARPRRADVISGGVTAARADVDMTRGANGRIRFRTTINSVDLLFDRLCTRVLDSALALRRGEVAVLNESNTAFGVAVAQGVQASAAADDTSDAPCRGLARVQFPMSISRLRAEYARHPASTALAPMPLGAKAARVPVDLQDPASSFESPPTMSDLTPAALERVMDDIGQTLLAHRVRVVIIVATDVRDRIFVANEVKRRLRDVRIVFVGSHTLYTRPEFNEQLRGALVVSTYPLFLENQYWTRLAPNQTERVVFSNELAEGTYNATVFQLAGISGYLALRDSLVALDSVSPAPWPRATASADTVAVRTAMCLSLDRGRLADYRAPHTHHPGERSDPPQPPVWITIIGRTTIAPIMAFPIDSALREGSAVIRGCPFGDPDLLAREALPTAFGPWEASMVLLFTFGAGIALFLAARPLVRSRRAADARRRAQADAAPGATPPGARISTPTSTTIAIPVATVPMNAATRRRLALQLVAMRAIRRRADVHAYTAGALRPVVALSAIVPLLLVPLRAYTHWWPLPPTMFAALSLALLSGIALAGLLAAQELMRLVPIVREADTPTAVHAVVMIAFGLLYTTTAVQFVVQTARMQPPMSAELLTRALQLGSGVTPVVPLVIGGTFLLVWAHQHARRAKWQRVHFAAEAWREKEARALRLGLIAVDADRYTLTCTGLLVVVAAWVAFNTQRSAESIPAGGRSGFDDLQRALIVAVLMLTTWAALRFIRTWSALRRELRRLAMQTFAPAFTRLDAAFSTLARLTPLDAPRPTHARTLVQTELDLRLRRLRGASSSAWERLFGPQAGRVASAFEDTDQYLGDTARQAARALDASFRRDTAFAWATRPGEDAAAARAAAEEVAAIFAADYVTWVIRQLRHLAIGLLASVVLGTMFLSCYPFEPHTFVRLCFFAVMGIAMAAIVVVLVQMNRDGVLSQLTGTNGGELTWDVPFLTNLVAVIGIPLLTLLGSEFPEVREFLFGWLAPLLKTVGRS